MPVRAYDIGAGAADEIDGLDLFVDKGVPGSVQRAMKEN
jgi:hypothetical protein